MIISGHEFRQSFFKIKFSQENQSFENVDIDLDLGLSNTFTRSRSNSKLRFRTSIHETILKSRQ